MFYVMLSNELVISPSFCASYRAIFHYYLSCMEYRFKARAV